MMTSTQRLLVDMLGWRRPSRDRHAQNRFAQRFLPKDATPDDWGNWTVRRGRKADQTILWSAHLDTVSRDDGWQRVIVTDDGIVQLPRGSSSQCLGADDTAGVWMLRLMADAGVPGVYVWHVDEEIGGIGSRQLADAWPYGRLRAAIAFDRRGQTDLIVEQVGQRVASQTAATWMIGQLAGSVDLAEATGTYTDTAEYVGLVDEVFNVSVGYSREHTQHETQNLAYADRLLDAVCGVDWPMMPTGEIVDDAPVDDWPDDWPVSSATAMLRPCPGCDDTWIEPTAQLCAACWTAVFGDMK